MQVKESHEKHEGHEGLEYEYFVLFVASREKVWYRSDCKNIILFNRSIFTHSTEVLQKFKHFCLLIRLQGSIATWSWMR
jgi:hypothetical protein